MKKKSHTKLIFDEKTIDGADEITEMQNASSEDLTLLEPDEILKRINACRREKMLHYKKLLENFAQMHEYHENYDQSKPDALQTESQVKSTKSNNMANQSRIHGNKQLKSHNKLHFDTTVAIRQSEIASCSYAQKVKKSNTQDLEDVTHVSTECTKSSYKRTPMNTAGAINISTQYNKTRRCESQAAKPTSEGIELNISSCFLKSGKKMEHKLSNYDMLKTKVRTETTNFHNSYKNVNSLCTSDNRQSKIAETNKAQCTRMDMSTPVNVGNYHQPHGTQNIENSINPVWVKPLTEGDNLNEWPCCSKVIRRTESKVNPPYTTSEVNLECNDHSYHHSKTKRNYLVEKIDKLLQPYETELTDEQISCKMALLEAGMKEFNDICNAKYYYTKFCSGKKQNRANYYETSDCSNENTISNTEQSRCEESDSDAEFQRKYLLLLCNNYAKGRASNPPDGLNQNTQSKSLGKIVTPNHSYCSIASEDMEKRISTPEVQQNLLTENEGRKIDHPSEGENICDLRTKCSKNVSRITERSQMQPNKMPNFDFFKKSHSEEEISNFCEPHECNELNSAQNIMSSFMYNCKVPENYPHHKRTSEDISKMSTNYTQSPVEDKLNINSLHLSESVQKASEAKQYLLSPYPSTSFNCKEYEPMRQTSDLEFKHQIEKPQYCEICCKRISSNYWKDSKIPYLNDLKKKFSSCASSNDIQTYKLQKANDVSISKPAELHCTSLHSSSSEYVSSHSASSHAVSSHSLSSHSPSPRSANICLKCSRSDISLFVSTHSFPSCSISSIYAKSLTATSVSAASLSIESTEGNVNDNLNVSQCDMSFDDLNEVESNSNLLRLQSPACKSIVPTTNPRRPVKIQVPQHLLGGVLYYFPRNNEILLKRI